MENVVECGGTDILQFGSNFDKINRRFAGLKKEEKKEGVIFCFSSFF